jgi:hypothetical protein
LRGTSPPVSHEADEDPKLPPKRFTRMARLTWFLDRDPGGNKICLREKALSGIDLHHPPNFGTAGFGPRAVAPLPHVGRSVGQGPNRARLDARLTWFVDRDAGGNKICLREKALSGIDRHQPAEFWRSRFWPTSRCPPCPMWGAMWGAMWGSPLYCAGSQSGEIGPRIAKCGRIVVRAAPTANAARSQHCFPSVSFDTHTGWASFREATFGAAPRRWSR